MNLLRLTMALALAFGVACGGSSAPATGSGGGSGGGGSHGTDAGGTGGGTGGGSGGGIGGGSDAGGANTAPVFGALSPRTLDEGTTATVTLTATDAESDALTFSLQSPPAFASLVGAVITLAPGFTNAGTYQLAVRVSDGKSSTDGVLAVTVTNVNQPPVLQPIADVSIVAGASGLLTLQGTDADGDALTYSTSTLPAFASLTAGTITFTPPVGTVLTQLITATVSDGVLTDARSFNLIVSPAPNQPPTLATPGQVDGANGPVAAGATVTTTPRLTATVADPEGDTVKLEVELRPLATAFTNVATHSAALGPAGLLQLSLGTLSAGSYKWQVRAVDSNGSASAFTAFNSGNLAFTVQQGAVSGSVVVNAGAASTITAAVTITLSVMATSPATLSQMRFSNDGVTFTAFESYAATKAWVLSGGDGDKTVTVEVRDSVNVTAQFTDTITLDSAPPTITSFNINNAAAATNTTVASLSWTATDTGTGVSKIEASNDGIAFVALTASPAAWTLLAGADGSRSVTLRATDAAGNRSTSTDSINLDTTPPVPGTLQIDGTNLFTTSTAVTLGFTASDAASSVTHFCAKELNAPPTSATDACWAPLVSSSAPFVLSSAQGAKTVYAWFKDAAGNYTVASISDTIGLDSVSPSLSSLQLNGGATYSKSLSVIATTTASDPAPGSAVTQASFSLDGVNFPTNTGYSAMLPFTFSAGEGLRTLYMTVGDGAGNTSGTASATITIDTVAPTGTVSINGGASYATTPAATVTLTATDATSAVTKMCLVFTNSLVPPATPAANDPCFTAFSSSVSVNLFSITDGVRSAWAWFQDGAGNVSAVATDSIVLDTNAPSTPAVPGVGTSHRTLGLTWAASTDATSGMAGYEVGTSTTSGGPYTFGSLLTVFTTNLTRPNGVPQFAVVRAVDLAGNKSPNSPEANGTPQYAFSHQYREPTASNINGVAFVGSGPTNRYFAIGYAGLLVSSDDGMATWVRRDPMTDGHLYGVIAGGVNVWTVGQQGHLSLSSDLGVVFNLVPTGTTQDLYAFTFAGSAGLAAHYVAVGASGTIVHGINGFGGTFSPTPSGVTDTLLTVANCSGGTVCANGDVLIAAGANGTVLRSADHGITWAKITNLPSGYVGVAGVTFNAVVNAAGTDTLFLGGVVPVGKSPLLRSNDGGQSWTANSGLAGFNVHALAAPNVTDLWVGGDVTGSSAGTIARMQGTTRTDQVIPQSPNIIQTISSIVARSSTELAAGSPGGGLLKTITAGPTWTEVSTNTRAVLLQVHIPRGGLFNQTAWAVGGSGLILRTVNGGAAWSQQALVGNTLYGAHLLDVGGTAATAQGYVVGTAGYIGYTLNGGTAWTTHADSAAVTNTLNDVDCRSNTACIAVGTNATVMVSTGALPGSWTVQTVAATTESYNGVATYLVGGTTPRAIVVGSAGSVRLLNNTTWSNGAGVPGAVFTDVAVKSDFSGVAIAVGVNGTIYKSLDHGVSWALKPSGTNQVFNAIEHAAGTTTWYAGGYGGLFKSLDDGETWAPLITNSLNTVNGITVSTNDPNRLWVVGNNGSTLFSATAGR